MIAKNIKAQAFAGVVNYVMKKDAEVLKAEGVMAMSAKDMITSFELQQSVRSEIKSPVGHIPISYAPEDKERMTNEFMLQLTEEYMQNMGIKNTQYIVVRHHDNPNEHIHIVYNRIDNSGNLITDKNDYKRNIATCKKLKDRHNLTYGKDKARVKLDKLQGSELTKHEIFHAVKAAMVDCRSFNELQNRLISHGIKIEYKHKRGTSEVQGLSFTKDNITFKGSRIDRKYSYKSLQNTFVDSFKHSNIPFKIGGVRLTYAERRDIDNGKIVFVRDLTDKLGGVYNAWLRYNEDKDKLDIYKFNPVTKQFTPDDPIKGGAIQQQPQQMHQEQSNADGTLVSGGTGLFDLPADGGDDPEEMMFKNKMQKKKKKGRGM